MKMSLSWINEFVDVAEYFSKPEVLSDVLTKAGLEVEELIDRKKNYQSVVTGLILNKDKHPNADRLTVCKVTTGEGVVHQIVCGATNHKDGDRVVVALPGAILPGNFAIKQSVIRGVDSGGMLCSTTELGLSKSSDGILILPNDAPIGEAFAKYMQLDDVIFDLKVTPNRADCLSHLGLAREISALTGKALKLQNSDLPVFSEKNAIHFENSATDLCSRYMGAVIENVKVNQSPDWLVRRLESVGLKSINNVVDITNYILMELGQPMHAFDREQIGGKKISVQKAQGAQKLKLLDQKEISLKGDELIISSESKTLALAGVMGGSDSGVSLDTKNIILESASFSSKSVRQTSRRFGVESDSAYRFSRGVDSNGSRFALARAIVLIQKLSGGELVQVYDSNPQLKKSTEVHLSTKFVEQKLGYPVTPDKLKNILKRLDCTFEEQMEGEFVVTSPTYRFDLESQVDFVEEYARMVGYDSIPETLPVCVKAPTPHIPAYDRFKVIGTTLQRLGCLQAWNLGFSADKSENKFTGDKRNWIDAGLLQNEKPVMVRNPLSEDLNQLRMTLIEGLFRNSLHNIKHNQSFGSLYEIGSVFSKSADNGFIENRHLGLCSWGSPTSFVNKTYERPQVYQLQKAIERTLELFKIKSFSWKVPSDKSQIPSCFHTNQYSVLFVEGKNRGFVGSVHPLLLSSEKIRTPVALAEMDLEFLLEMAPRKLKVESFSDQPMVQRDVSYLVERKIQLGEMVSAIKKKSPTILKSLEVVDIFESKDLGLGKKSVTIRLFFQDPLVTLQENQILEATTAISQEMTQKFSAQLR